MTNHPNIVIVNDGQYRWGADRTELLASLERLGWIRHGSQWTEPASSADDDPTSAYTDLCQIVQPAVGYGPDDRGDWDALAQFTARDDMGRGVWQYSAV